MDFVNCPKCGKLFMRDKEPLCEACMADEEKLFLEVKQFIEENRGCSMEDVCHEKGVTPKKIMKWLKDGRLEISDGMGDALTCEKCGKTIKRGRYCSACTSRMDSTINAMLGTGAPEKKTPVYQGLKMHTRDSSKQ